MGFIRCCFKLFYLDFKLNHNFLCKNIDVFLQIIKMSSLNLMDVSVGLAATVNAPGKEGVKAGDRVREIFKKIFHNKNEVSLLQKLKGKLFITYYNTKKHKQKTVSIYKNKEYLIECLLRSSHIPYLMNGKASYKNKWYSFLLNLKCEGEDNTLLKKYPEAYSSIRIHAYGAPLDSLTTEAIERFGLEDVVIAHGRLEKDAALGQSGRERVIEKMQQADVLILLHGQGEECAEYIPSKLYDYLWTGRPIWAVTHRNPQLNEMLIASNAYLSASGDDAKLALTLEKIWHDWLLKKLNPVMGSPIGVNQAVQKILETIKVA
jgi:transcriptional regulator